MAPNFSMLKEVEFQSDPNNMLPVEEFDAEGYELKEVDLDGDATAEEAIEYEDDEVCRAIYNIPLDESFFGCINCYHPIAMMSSLKTIIWIPIPRADGVCCRYLSAIYHISELYDKLSHIAMAMWNKMQALQNIVIIQLFKQV